MHLLSTLGQTFLDTSLLLTDTLIGSELPAPDTLPSHAILPFQRNQDFVGREEDLLQIAHLLGKGGQNGRLPVVAITGWGGVGKSQTAIEFCYRYGRYFPAI